MALLIPIVVSSRYRRWLTVTLKYDNHGGGQKTMLLTKDHGTGARQACAYIEYKLDLTRPDEITEEKHE